MEAENGYDGIIRCLTQKSRAMELIFGMTLASKAAHDTIQASFTLCSNCLVLTSSFTRIRYTHCYSKLEY
ncbi:hypothetical protein Peur_055347 [Populus x canadensis]